MIIIIEGGEKGISRIYILVHHSLEGSLWLINRSSIANHFDSKSFLRITTKNILVDSIA